MQNIEIRDTRNGNWFWIENAVLTEYFAKIGALGFTLYSCLAMLSKNSPVVSSSYSQLGKLLGLSPRTIMRTIQTLVDTGLIAVEKRIDKTQGQEANIYTLLAVRSSISNHDKINSFTNVSNVTPPYDKPDTRKVTNDTAVTPPMTNHDKINSFTNVSNVTPPMTLVSPLLKKEEEEKNKKEKKKEEEVVSPSLDASQSSQKNSLSISSFPEKLVEEKLESEPKAESEQTALVVINPQTTQPLVESPTQTKTLTNQQRLLEAFVLLLRLDMRIYKGGYARLAKEISRFYNAEITPEQVQKFAKWWYTEDFRGQKDQPPTLDQFSKLLTTALHWTDPETIQIDQPTAEITISRPQQPRLIPNKAIQAQQMIDAMFEAKRRKTQC